MYVSSGNYVGNKVRKRIVRGTEDKYSVRWTLMEVSKVLTPIVVIKPGQK